MSSTFRSLFALTMLLSPAAVRAEPVLADRALAVLQTHCARCHGPGGQAKGGFDFVLDRERLVSRGKIIAGKPAESPLFGKVTKGEMPPASQKTRPTADDIAILQKWIETGAALPTVPARTFVSDGDVLRMIHDDLQKLPQKQRRFMRYLTLAHLANAGVTDAELQQTRQAVSKLVNSLSWHPRISIPANVDANGLVLRLDLRDYQWTALLWDKVQVAYPYRINRDTPEAKAIAKDMGSEQPHVRADWFVATVSRPPLYHDFLALPGTDREMERLLRVEVLTNLQEERVARAGFNESGVSRNNRVIERHDASFGAYWRSYDFSDNTERQNVFQYPLGPLPGTTSFKHVGGELIFNLPNGLQGYMLVDGRGRRIDKGPVEIVSDPKRPDRSVETGLSCMSCHVQGLIPKADQVRAHVAKNPNAFSQTDRESVNAIYPPEATLRKLLDEDVERFTKALAKTGVKPEEPEPVSTVTLRYEGVLDLASAAAEMGMTPDEFTRRLRELPSLSRILGPVLARGGTLQRSAVQAAFPELVREFRLDRDGKPTTPAASANPFPGHTGYIACVTLSPDGKRALSGSEDQTIRLWDVATGNELLRLTGHTQEVLSVAFAPDGKHAVSGGRDRTVRLWDLATGKAIRTIEGHTDRVTSVAFSPDGKRLLSASWDQTARIWDVESGKELQRFSGHGCRVHVAIFSADGKQAVSGGADGVVRLWRTDKGKEVRRLEGHTRDVHALAISSDGKTIVSGGTDRVVRLWDAKTGKERQRFEGHAGSVIAVALGADAMTVTSAASQYRGSDKPLRIWDVENGKERDALGSTTETVWCLAFSADGKSAISGTSEKMLRVWQLSK